MSPDPSAGRDVLPGDRAGREDAPRIRAPLGRVPGDGLEQALQALRESEERFEALAHSSYDLICETDADGRLIYLSPNFQDVLGHDPRALLGHTILALVHADDKAAVRAEFRRTIRAVGSGRVVHRLRHKDGGWRWFESAGRAYRARDGAVHGVAVCRDITERKHAEEALEQSNAH
jgi:PAS domain S-box-containing protein